MITTVLFDLDGTLLPMDQDVFIADYFRRLAATLGKHGYDPQKLTQTIWQGTAAMVTNDGSRTNEEAFWEAAEKGLGPGIRQDKPLFDDFYLKEFDKIREVCGFNPLSSQIVRELKAAGKRVILATNPLFPAVATQCRIRWAGLQPEDFEWITTYENSHYCKPNPDYYRQILQLRGLQPEECVMVGNDAQEDVTAQSLGIRVFLLTDCLINKKNLDLSPYPHGDMMALQQFLQQL